MTSNARTTSGDDDLPRGTNVPTDIGARERQPRAAPIAPAAAPAASRPLSKPAPSGLSTQPQRATRVIANFDPASSREALIATTAYYRAQQRGFEAGHELQDWLAAEREIDGAGSDPI